MSEAMTIARPYARAAFAQAREEGQLAEWSEVLGLLRQMVSEPQLRALIGDPRFDRARLTRLLLESLPECSRSLENFLHLLVQAGRLPVLAAVCEIFESLYAQAEGLVRVQVQSAFPLTQAQHVSLAQALTRRFGGRVQLREEVDAGLIGGVVLRRGDTVIDASLRGRLQRLRTLLAEAVS